MKNVFVDLSSADRGGFFELSDEHGILLTCEYLLLFASLWLEVQLLCMCSAV
jgi:hypothetical protein